MRSKYRLGVDAGGTFTDFVLADEQGHVRLYKTPSTPHKPTEAILAGLALMSEDLGRNAAEIVGDCDLCINGTTVALNALIQHKGSSLGLLCTAGHRDSIEIRLGHKEEGHRYDAKYPSATMLVPRYLRRPINERVLSDGTVRTPLDEDEVREAAEFFKREGVRAVAISFLWSVLNPVHERRAAEIVREVMPDAYVTLGTEIFPQTREYTRTSTVVVNGYLGPIMRDYVKDIDALFAELGARHPVRYFQSNGGLAIGDALVDRAVYAINSGPAAGPAAGLYVASPFGLENVITVDMGGTSFDITLTRKGVTNVQKNEDFLRYRIGVPMLHVETLGAGGGSIARIDEMGVLQVGPESAGANPGPACYGRGGTRPTVTDCNLVLGYLSPDGLLGGKLRLDRDVAVRVIKQHLADPLRISVEEAAFGVFTIVNNNMVNGIRRVSIEKGLDPRDFALVSAGGAASVHITSLAREMGIRTVLVPKLASCLCAFGQIISDVKYNYLATNPVRLDDKANLAAINETFARMEREGIERLVGDGFPRERIKVQRTVDMRYVDQIHECTVDIPKMEITPANVQIVRDAFHDKHEQLYTYAERHNLVEIVNLESAIIGEIDKPAVPALERAGPDPAAARIGTRELVLGRSERREAPVYDGAMLRPGSVLTGPAVIVEETTSILVEPDWRCTLHESGTYLVEQLG
ncbi:MAG: hydantoinase/oxoprolinase family protein [Alphaproteobacteria bacterium]